MSHWFGLKWFRKPNVIWTRKQIGAAHFVKLYFFFVIQYCCFPFWSIGFVMLSYVNSFFFFLFAHHEIGHDIVHIIVETLVRRIAVSCVFHVIKICFDSFSRIESAIKCNHFHFYRTNVIVTLLTNAETRAKKKKKNHFDLTRNERDRHSDSFIKKCFYKLFMWNAVVFLLIIYLKTKIYTKHIATNMYRWGKCNAIPILKSAIQQTMRINKHNVAI